MYKTNIDRILKKEHSAFLKKIFQESDDYYEICDLFCDKYEDYQDFWKVKHIKYMIMMILREQVKKMNVLIEKRFKKRKEILFVPL